MKQWYTNLTHSERRLIVVGSITVMLALFWTLIYLPINQKIDSQVEIRNRLNDQLIEMQGLGQVSASQLRKKISIPQNMTFSSWVDLQLSQLGLQELVNRTEPIDSKTLTVWLNNAPFDQVIDWLQRIHLSHGIKVDQIDVNVTDRSLGYTNIRMRLVSP